jgi:hypothetical protein
MLYSQVDESYCVYMFKSIKSLWKDLEPDAENCFLDQNNEIPLTYQSLKKELKFTGNARIYSADGNDWITKIEEHRPEHIR